MTESGSWRDEVEATVGDEVSLIVEAFARRGIDIEVVTNADGGLGYMFARGQLLVRDQYLTRVLEILGSRTERELRDSEPDAAAADHARRATGHPRPDALRASSTWCPTR